MSFLRPTSFSDSHRKWFSWRDASLQELPLDSSEYSVPEEHPHLSAEVTEVGHEVDVGQRKDDTIFKLATTHQIAFNRFMPLLQNRRCVMFSKINHW